MESETHNQCVDGVWMAVDQSVENSHTFLIFCVFCFLLNGLRFKQGHRCLQLACASLNKQRAAARSGLGFV